MRDKSFEKTKYFVLAFCGAFVLLSLLALWVALKLRSTDAQLQSSTLEPEGTTDHYYVPRVEDNLNVLLMGREKPEAAPTYFFLVRLDVEDGALPVAVFPPQTVVRYNEKSVTLLELGAKNGVKAVQQALAELLEVPVERYVLFSGEAVIAAVDMIGFMEYDLPQALHYQDEAISISLAKGRQQLDGQRFYDVLRYPAYPTAQRRAAAAAELLSSYLNQRLKVVLNPQADAIFRSVINLTESDLGFADYDSRKEALHFLAKLSGKHARAVTVNGTYNTAGDSMALLPDTKTMLHSIYQ